MRYKSIYARRSRMHSDSKALVGAATSLQSLVKQSQYRKKALWVISNAQAVLRPTPGCRRAQRCVLWI